MALNERRQMNVVASGRGDPGKRGPAPASADQHVRSDPQRATTATGRGAVRRQTRVALKESVGGATEGEGGVV